MNKVNLQNFMGTLNLKNFIAMAVFHVGMAVAVIFFFSWRRFLLAAIVYTVGLCPGIGAGFHRLLTHRGYKTYKWVEYGLTLCGYLVLQGGAIWWVAWHRMHHKYAEKTGLDPHTPHDGRWWSHMGWLILKNPGLKDPGLLTKYASDLYGDKFHKFLNTFAWMPITVFGLTVLAAFGFKNMCWAVFVPVVFAWHSTWLVNSATHLWGSRAFETPDDSRNSWWVALLTFGEGWHNNHHKAQVRARHGIRWWQYDPNYYLIVVLEYFGLAWDIR